MNMTTTSRISSHDIHIQSEDGTSLASTLFMPDGYSPTAALLINSGTGIPRRFYRRFAQFAARRGFVTLTYDYRGIGGSAPDSLRGYEARYRDWGQLDIPGAINWLSENHGDLPLFVVGHSTGGQQLGLAHNVDRVTAAVFVTVSTGYWKGMPSPYRYVVYALLRGYIPATTKLYGFAPAKKVRWGENLPVGVAREWGAWSLEPEYMAAYFDEGGRKTPLDGSPFGPTNFEKAHFPILAYYFTDDPISTRETAPPMMELYSKATVEERWGTPESLGVEEVGHLGFFRSGVGGPLWDEALGWLYSHYLPDQTL